MKVLVAVKRVIDYNVNIRVKPSFLTGRRRIAWIQQLYLTVLDFSPLTHFRKILRLNRCWPTCGATGLGFTKPMGSPATAS